MRPATAVELVRTGGGVWQFTVVSLPAALYRPVVVAPFNKNVRVFVTVVLSICFVIVIRSIRRIIVVPVIEITICAVVICRGKKRAAAERALTYMGLKPGMPIKDIAVDTVFIGSCTNGRIDDLRQAASIMKGHHKAENIHRVLVVPASSRVRLQAEKEGLDKVFEDFGAEWRNAGCSMCLGMNPDKLVPGERSISTSNRNFEGRQGKGSRTHLASPAVAAATAIRGTISSPADL